MAAQSQGIRQLMAAEKEAAQVVSDARKRKNQRLKEAKEEAQKEIEEYRQQRKRQFEEQQSRHAGSKDESAQQTKLDTQQKLVVINRQVEEHKQEVITRLLELVYDIKPEIHQNARLNK